MALKNAEFNVVCNAIRQTLTDHITSPFGLIREQTLVSEIYRHLRNDKGIIQTTKAALQAPNPPAFKWPGSPTVNRVQCEMQVDIKDATGAVRPSVIDLVVFQAGKQVSLTVHGNGPGDVIQQVNTVDVAAAIECKASPSKLDGQKKSYTKDLQDLYDLAASQGTDCFFVLLDKTQPLYGTPVPLTPAWAKHQNWCISSIRIGHRGISPRAVKTATSPGISSKSRTSKPSVWIFTVDGKNIGEYVLT